MYPQGTNHFSPYSTLFKKEHRTFLIIEVKSTYVFTFRFLLGKGIIISDIGIAVMVYALMYASRCCGWKLVIASYFLPYVVSGPLNLHGPPRFARCEIGFCLML